MVEAQTISGSGMHAMNHGNVALIVEDDPLVRRAIVRGLSVLGFICESAASMDEARRMSGPWDVAVVDIDLPDGSGVDLLERSVARELRTPPVFFSATEDPEVILRASRLGHFISKAEGIGAVLAHLGPHREREAPPAGKGRVSAAPTSGARSLGWTAGLEEQSAPALQVAK